MSVLACQHVRMSVLAVQIDGHLVNYIYLSYEANTVLLIFSWYFGQNTFKREMLKRLKLV